MEGQGVTATLAVCGAMFAIGGALSACLQTKWLREQHKSLQEILDVLHAMQAESRPLGGSGSNQSAVFKGDIAL